MKPDHSITRIALLRHARTEWNEEQRIQGWQDSPLSVAGYAQANHWAAGLSVSPIPSAPTASPAVSGPFDFIISSDLGRARETARIIADQLGLAVQEEPRFRERHFGALEGRMADARPVEAPHDLPDDMEPLSALHQRAIEGLMALRSYGSVRILAIVHHGILQSVLSSLAGPEYPLREGRLLKSNRMHWVGLSDSALGLLELNARILP